MASTDLILLLLADRITLDHSEFILLLADRIALDPRMCIIIQPSIKLGYYPTYQHLVMPNLITHCHWALNYHTLVKKTPFQQVLAQCMVGCTSCIWIDTHRSIE